MLKSLTERPWVWALLWALPIAAALIYRPVLPIDETRYLSVAWEMWLRGDFLVPHLNGEPYSHKPPLLFWLMNAGWWVFGVNSIWPRLVSPLFGLGCVLMVSRLARRLWPDSDAGTLAPLLLLGCTFWALFSTLTMFDMLLAFWTLVGIDALLSLSRTGRWVYVLPYGAAIGLGVLSKGPVILVFLLPAALFAPLWRARGGDLRWRRWYGATVLGVLLGAAIGLAWAIPAGIAGGATYREEIFWGQSAGRVVESFAHRRSWWFYFAFLPAGILPWLLWPSLVRATWHKLHSRFAGPRDEGFRLCAIWVVAGIAFLSLFSGKQVHYLLPLFPGLALIGAAVLNKTEAVRGRWDIALPLAVVFIIAIARVVIPLVDLPADFGAWAENSHPMWPIVLVLLVVGLIIVVPKAIPARAGAIAIAGSLLIASINGMAGPQLREAYDISGVARYLAAAQAKGYEIANVGNYHAQFNFLGGLKRPVFEAQGKQLKEWMRKHPKAKIVSYPREKPTRVMPEYVQRFRGRWVAVWDEETIKRMPEVLYARQP